MDTVHTVTGPERRSWHLDKTLNVSHIITTLAIAGTLFGYASSMDKRVAILEEQMRSQQQATISTQDSVRSLQVDVRDELRALRAEIIRLTEQGARQK